MKKSFKCISLMLSSLLILGCGSTAFSAATVEDNESVKAIYERLRKAEPFYTMKTTTKFLLKNLITILKI